MDKQITRNWMYYVVSLVIFYMFSSKNDGFMAVDLMRYDIIQWISFMILGLLFSFGLTYVIFKVIYKFRRD